MKNAVICEPELSRPLVVDKISAGGVAEHIVAIPAERKALAERFGLLEIRRLEANLDIDHSRNDMIAVTGSMSADVVQQCVVSLDPVPSTLTSPINALFAPARLIETGEQFPHGETIEDDPPEPIVNGIIDLGELVAQHLAQAINPYPRKEGAVLPPHKGQDSTAAKPFAKLVELKDK